MSVPTTEPHGSGAQPIVAVDLGRLPGIRRFAIDYAQRFASVKDFFAGDPTSPDGWRDAIARAGHERVRDDTYGRRACTMLERAGVMAEAEL